MATTSQKLYEHPPETLANFLAPNRNIGRSLASFDDLPRLSSDRDSRPSSSHRSSPRSSRPSSPHGLVSPTSRRSTPHYTPPSSPHPKPEHRLLLPPKQPPSELQTDAALKDPTLTDPPETPLIVLFHGSRDSCHNSWRPLARNLSQTHRVLMWERSSSTDYQGEAHALTSYLFQHNLSSTPLILVAHSHGGAFARCFLHFNSTHVAGMVLVETGQEASWDEKLQEKQEEQHALGSRPLVVIKGRSLLHKWQGIDAEEAKIKDRQAKGEVVPEAERARCMVARNEMRRWEKEDEKLKRRQLKLSKRNKWVEVQDVGHHVVRDRPAVVQEAVEWVLEHLDDESDSSDGGAGGVERWLRASGDHGGGRSGRSSRRNSRERERDKDSGKGKEKDKQRNGSVLWLKKVSLGLLGGGHDEDKPSRRSSR